MIPIGIFLYSSRFNPEGIKNTSAYIIETVAPIFNRKGYVGTSLSDLTKATGLTKGAIYGNFRDKEDLAVQSFKHNVRSLLSTLTPVVAKAKRPIDKLYAITGYYRGYFDITKPVGGCPILNVGSDAHHTNPVLFRLVKLTSKRLEEDILHIILDGIEQGEFKKTTDSGKVARNMYSMIEGSVFMATTHEDRNYIIHMMDHIEEMIQEKLMA